jgi:hypothetical protein
MVHMTVRELIARLQVFDGDLRVVRDGEDFMYFVRDVQLVGDDDAREDLAGAELEHLPADSAVLIS